MKTTSNTEVLHNSFLRLVLCVGVLLLIPLAAMQFTDQVNWTGTDFVAAAILLFGGGLAYLLLSRKMHTTRQRVIAGAVVLLVFMYLWAELAVGIFTHLGS